MGKYKRMPPPWISKSKLNKDDWCGFDYYEHYVLQIYTKTRLSVEGTNMHMVLHRFFKKLKMEDLIEPEERYQKLLGEGKTFFDVDKNIPIDRQPFRRFIYEMCMKHVPPKHRGYPKYKLILSNFATIECERWIKLNDMSKNKEEILKYFKPILLEQRFEFEKYYLFGTIDRVDVEILPNKTRKILIIDYKTGKVPPDIQAGLQKPLNQYSWKLGSDKMKELHFYGLIYLFYNEWELKDELNHFLLSDEWLRTKIDSKNYIATKELKKEHYKSLGAKKARIYKDGKTLKKGDILVCVYYLGGDKPYKVVKEFNYTSFGTLIKHINDLRSREKHNMYITDPRLVFDEIVCEKYKGCSKFEHCKELVEELNKSGK